MQELYHMSRDRCQCTEKGGNVVPEWRGGYKMHYYYCCYDHCCHIIIIIVIIIIVIMIANVITIITMIAHHRHLAPELHQ